MPRLTDFLLDYPPFVKLAAKLETADLTNGAFCAGVPGFIQAYVIGGLLSLPAWRTRPALIVAPDQDLALGLEHELALYLDGRDVVYLPPRGVWYGSETSVQPRVAGRRARALEALQAQAEGRGAATVLVLEASTLLEGVIVPDRLGLRLSRGAHHDFDELISNLCQLGYRRVDQAENPGEFSVRGGIIDVFPSTDLYPVRIEFWGDEIESLRRFSIFTQRSIQPVESVLICAAAEGEGSPVPITSLLPREAFVFMTDPLQARARVEAFAADLADIVGGSTDAVGSSTGAVQGYYSWEEVQASLSEMARVFFGTVHSTGEDQADAQGEDEEVVFRAASGDLAAASLPEVELHLSRLVDEGYRVVIAFEHKGEAERAPYILKRVPGVVESGGEIAATPGVTYLAIPYRRHFVLPDLKLALLTESVVFPRRRKVAGARPRPAGLELSSFRDLRKGDYVVHEDYGIGRFVGISTRTVGGVTRDYLDLLFRDGDMLYVPHEQIGKVMRYVGMGGAAPSLSKLGGRSWEHIKSKVRRAAAQVAGELLHLYALRQASKGYAFSADTDWQAQFERAFPYEETEDQLRAIDVVKDDMESERPMDRLICGDVGYGKTEVALRAVFKAVQDGKQVMVLVPTTILAQQHYATFRERFAEFPVRVEMISRFRTAAEQRRILRDFAQGRVDVLIGTHRLLSPDVKPKDLGLVVIDEEQRFGVAQKELLRRLKLQVDVLTLTATPIPRTLQMSLSGVRDITTIETPPRDRHPIQTYVGAYDEGIVKRAIEREISRGGQVFYLHNRVDTIEEAASRLRQLVPSARIAVAHGQMPENELERVMVEFLRGDWDVLVTTTIIESGLDIPNANTLIVERADLLGLAQLYQIRGRIGRSSRVAHAFLFHPGEEALTQEAAARLSTLADYTELGSGFKIALRDLEIRGAGELLGEEQSGHIAAVGFEMYLSMLREAAARLRGEEIKVHKMPRVELPIDAYVPASFVSYEAARVDLHRRIAQLASMEEVADLRQELRDRFGVIPEPVENLLFLAQVRIVLQELGADLLSVERGRLVIGGLELPAGSREKLRQKDRRYVYAPVQRQLALGLRGDEREVRVVVREVLGDILGLLEKESPWSGE
ncbi:MAG: transcription-repair coupling factor [Thermoleophilia bacterium]|nr:transcription-repair coupling factor [Thermoleophilia bacterium]